MCICLSICLVYLSVYMSIRLSACLSIYLYLCLSLYLCIRLSVCLSGRLYCSFCLCLVRSFVRLRAALRSIKVTMYFSISQQDIVLNNNNSILSSILSCSKFQSIPTVYSHCTLSLSSQTRKAQFYLTYSLKIAYY